MAKAIDRPADERRSQGLQHISGSAPGILDEFHPFLNDVRARCARSSRPSQRSPDHDHGRDRDRLRLRRFSYVVDGLCLHRCCSRYFTGWAALSRGEAGSRTRTAMAEEVRTEPAEAAERRSATSTSSGTSSTPIRALSARCGSRSRAACRPSVCRTRSAA